MKDEATIDRDLNGYPGEVRYRVRADLGSGRSLSFHVVMRRTDAGWEAEPKMDGGAPGATFDAARHRLAEWFEAAARAMRGDVRASVPVSWGTPDDEDAADAP